MSLYYLTQFFYLKLNFKLKIDPKTCSFENLENWPKKFSIYN